MDTEDSISIINENQINELLEKTRDPSESLIADILSKAQQLKGLEPEETAALLNIEEEHLLEQLFSTALTVKEEIYGSRLVLFAPMYVSNHCTNNCLYCGFRKDNRTIGRTMLSLDEVRTETEAILDQGHKRILMLMGEHTGECSLDYFLDAVRTAYSVNSGKSSIRRINVEIAPLDMEEFEKLRKVKIGTYTVFQETYHRSTYDSMHPSGKKADYEWRLTVMDRALQAGLGDVGIGALFGLYDYRFEVMALFQHSAHLMKTYGIGPHTISIPRIEPALNAPAALDPPYPVSDRDFKKIVAAIRVSVPYTGIILSTRESPSIRREVLNLGVSQMSAGSKTNPGGYAGHPEEPQESQFSINDTRTTGEVIKDVIALGFIPSFCTGCYRMGRTGADFMDLAKPGLIKNFCLPNALLTLKEYLVDYADEETRRMGEKLIATELAGIPSEKVRLETLKRLERTENGETDLYF